MNANTSALDVQLVRLSSTMYSYYAEHHRCTARRHKNLYTTLRVLPSHPLDAANER